MIARNRPYDEFVRGIVAAAGEWQDAPAINWYWQMRDDQLHQVDRRHGPGVPRHPPAVRQVPSPSLRALEPGRLLRPGRLLHPPGPQELRRAAALLRRRARHHRREEPAAPARRPSRSTSTARSPSSRPEEDPRHALVDWMARPDNPFFAKALVNRLWGHFLGRGLSITRWTTCARPTRRRNPELLDALAKDFIEHKFDVKHVIRTILQQPGLSAQSSEPTEDNKNDQQNFARYYARRLIGRGLPRRGQPGDCGTRADFSGVAANARAVDLPHEGFGSYFLDTFDRPRRVTGCECERSSGATLAQVLLLANSDEIENKIADGDGRVAKLVKEKKTTRRVVEELYLTALSRRPTDGGDEADARLRRAGRRTSSRPLEDVLWAILNTQGVHVQSLRRRCELADTVREARSKRPCEGFDHARLSACDGVSRRSFLKVGQSGPRRPDAAAACSAAAAPRQAGTRRKRKSVILIWLAGGPSHIDMYDLKPDAPAEFRGEFKPIATNVPGIQIGEHLPLQARIMDKLAIVRSAYHTNAGHGMGSQWMLTGYQPTIEVNDNIYPSTRLGRRQDARGQRAAACRPTSTCRGMLSLGKAAYLGASYNPFAPDSDPNDRQLPGAQPEAARPRRRDPARAPHASCCSDLDTIRRDIDTRGRHRGLDTFYRDGHGDGDRAPRRSEPSTSTRSRRRCASATAATTWASAACWPGGWSRRA